MYCMLWYTSLSGAQLSITLSHSDTVSSDSGSVQCDTNFSPGNIYHPITLIWKLKKIKNIFSDSDWIRRIMADEDTDWSYSETIPKPQISTLSRFQLSFVQKCLYQLCFDCKLIYWELLRTNTSDYLFKVFCTKILLRL